jgi:hypothetical protein
MHFHGHDILSLGGQVREWKKMPIWEIIGGSNQHGPKKQGATSTLKIRTEMQEEPEKQGGQEAA